MDTDIFKSTVRRESPDRYFQFVAWLERFIKARRVAFRMRLYRVQCHFLCQLRLFKFVFSVLRRFRPVFIFHKLMIVTQAREVREVLERFGLPVTLDESVDVDAVLEAIGRDKKKTAEGVGFVLLSEPGKPRTGQVVDPARVREAVEELRR